MGPARGTDRNGSLQLDQLLQAVAGLLGDQITCWGRQRGGQGQESQPSAGMISYLERSTRRRRRRLRPKAAPKPKMGKGPGTLAGRFCFSTVKELI